MPRTRFPERTYQGRWLQDPPRIARAPPPILRLGLPDAFPHNYGVQADLWQVYGLLPEQIAARIPAYGAEQSLLPAIWNPATTTGAAMLNAEVTRQAAAIGYSNDFWLMMVLTLCAMPLVLLMHSGRHDTGGSASDAAAAAH